MTIKRLHARRIGLLAVGMLAVTALLFAVMTPRILARPAEIPIPLPEADCTLVDVIVDYEQAGTAGADAAEAVTSFITALCGPDDCRTYQAPIGVALYSTDPANLSNDLIELDWKLVADNCAPKPAPALWASDVCEQYYGGYFSADGNITLDSDQVGAPLYAGPGPDGPWYQLEANGPPWVFSMEQMQAIADWVGAGDMTQLWFRVNEDGTPASLSSMVEDRIVRIGDWCSPIMGGPTE